MLRLEFVEAKVVATATLLDYDAPAVCEAMWKGLEVPLEARATHAMASGQEIMINMPEVNRRFDPSSVPTQNATIHPAPGDILWTYLPPLYLKDFREGLWDFIVVYGQCILTSRATGPIISSNWAKIGEGFVDFATECAKTYVDGQKLLRVSRYEIGP